MTRDQFFERVAPVVLDWRFGLALNIALGTFFTACGVWGWMNQPTSIATAVNMWCGGIWFGYAIMAAIKPRITTKWRKEMEAEVDKMGNEMIQRINREMIRSMWSPTITPPDDPPRRLQ